MVRIKACRNILHERLDYIEKPRRYGDGEIRIGTRLELNEDIFSLSYVLMMKDRVVCQYFDVISGHFWRPEDKELREEMLEAMKHPLEEREHIASEQLYGVNDEVQEVDQFFDFDEEKEHNDMLRSKVTALLQQKRSTVRIHAYLTSFFQLMLSFMTFKELVMTCSYYSVFFLNTEITELLVGFVCISILHLSLIETSQQYLAMAKFCINHPYLFS